MKVLSTALRVVAVSLALGSPAWCYIDVIDTHFVSATPDLEQTVRFARVDGDPRRVLVTTRERDPASGEWHESELRLTAAFAVHEVASVLPGELFMVGREADGSSVVERWRIEPREGARCVSRARPSSPLGEARPVEPFARSYVGGAWIPPDQRDQDPPWVDRLRLHRGSPLMISAVDPDGRFLLVSLARPLRLARLDLSRPGAVEVLVTAVELPELDLGMLAVRRLSRGAERTGSWSGPGRVYALHTSTPVFGCVGPEPERGRTRYLVDRDNDGLFEELTTVLRDLPERGRGLRAPDRAADSESVGGG